MSYNIVEGTRVPVKAWNNNVHMDFNVYEQLRKAASLPVVSGISLMPDGHVGIGATVGSVIATRKAVIPSAVGVDIGCGMCAVKLSLTAEDLPESLSEIRSAIEAAIPVGQASRQEANKNVNMAWRQLQASMDLVNATTEGAFDKRMPTAPLQIGTLGGGNHFIELCLDESNNVWLMLHSGSRGIGNAIGSYYINKAKELAEKEQWDLPDRDLGWLPEGTSLFNEYWNALQVSQEYASLNRQVMLMDIIGVLKGFFQGVDVDVLNKAINCHHNYANIEKHLAPDTQEEESLYITRKGAVNAEAGKLGIIPGSMGAKSYIVRGLGNKDSFCSCSHGAGRVMSRGKAKELISLEEHEAALAGIECRKDEGVLDESPAAYKEIDTVIKAQEDLVEIVHTLKQVMCIKG